MYKLSFKSFIEASVSSKELKEKVLNSKFFRSILSHGGKPHIVGGYIRDSFLNRESKDIDLIVSGIPEEELKSLLGNFGRVNKVGADFGVYKFEPDEFEVPEPIDIALPRTERPMNQDEKEEYKKTNGKYPSAYQAFKTEPDHNFPVERDLVRRDFTINAIAQDHLGNISDPHGGLKDLKLGTIKMVDKKVFFQDPLRMLRGVQFASRFNFKIEPETFKEIQDNAKLIHGIPGERILIELEKIVSKGSMLLGADLLCQTNLWQEITGLSCSSYDKKLFDLAEKSRQVSEFLFLMMQKTADVHKALNICKRLKCDAITERQLKGLYLAWNKEDNPYQIVFELNRLHPSCLSLQVLPDKIKEAIKSDMPKTLGDLQINGDELMKLGYKGQEIGLVLKDILNQVFNGRLENSKDSILKYLNKN